MQPTKINLHSYWGPSPLTHVYFHTSRTLVKENYITFGVSARSSKQPLAKMTEYLNTMFQGLDAWLVTKGIASEPVEKGTNQPTPYREIPSHIKVANYMQARQAIDELVKHQEMSHEDRDEIEDALCELEKSGQFASKCTDYISDYQRAVIHNAVSPYMEAFKAETPDKKTAKEWLDCTATAITLTRCDHRKLLPSFLWTGCRSGNGKTEQFYDSLFAIGKVYASKGGLEDVLDQTDESMPSKQLVQNTILEFFN